MRAPRENLLISLCFAALPEGEGLRSLSDLIVRLKAEFRYYEVLIVTESPADPASEVAVLTLGGNIRLLRVRTGTSFYRRRAISAIEAIGDVVFLGAIEELDRVDPVVFLTEAAAGQYIIQAARDRRIGSDPFLRLLGRGSGFRIGGGEMLSAAYPRTLLNALLRRSDRDLALRFAPRDSNLPVRTLPLGGGAVPSSSGLRARLSLIQKLLNNAAPRVLGLVAALSVLVAVTALLFALYAMIAWAVLDEVQPGWLTISLVLSLTAMFLGAAIFGLATGLMKVLDLLAGDTLGEVLDERGEADLFALVTEDLNVELSTLPVRDFTSRDRV